MSGSILKLIACAAMLIDHIAAFLPDSAMDMSSVIFSLDGKEITLRLLMRAIGRIAFPIFAFLITEGYAHTRNRKRYALNLLMFALISEIPFNLAGSGEISYIYKQNVFFTLLFGYLGIYSLDEYRKTKENTHLLHIVALFILSFFMSADYGCFGFGFIMLLHLLRSNKAIMVIVGTCVLPSRLMAGTAFIPICMYNGKRGFATGKIAKYAFYLFYPIHLFILYLIHLYYV